MILNRMEQFMVIYIEFKYSQKSKYITNNNTVRRAEDQVMPD